LSGGISLLFKIAILNKSEILPDNGIFYRLFQE
jgi:hypothetical protein